MTAYKRAIELPFAPPAKTHATLSKLLQFPSVLDTSSVGQGIPYGQATVDALDFMLSLAKEDGFTTRNLDNHIGYIELKGQEEADYIGVLCHLDVVPAGNYWSFEPFGGTIAEDRIVGRGALDDKGPAVASYYALKAIKDSGIALKHPIRLILGLNEETGSKCVAHYNKTEKPPIAGFTPDADFPVIYAEKGITSFKIKANFKRSHSPSGIELLSVNGGTVVNMVPDTCEAVFSVNPLEGPGYDLLLAALEGFVSMNPVKMECHPTEKSASASYLTTVILKGTSAHASTPEAGHNAVSYMMAFLGTLPLGDGDMGQAIAAYNRLIGLEYYGESLGMGLWDEPSGKLTLNVGTVHMDIDGMMLHINVRYPVTCDGDAVYCDLVKENVANAGWELEAGRVVAPIVHDREGKLVQTLMSVYRDHTGDVAAEPISIGGGTYARSIPGIVAFGPLFPHSHDTMHQADEYITKEDFDQLVRMYADAMLRLSE